MGNHTGQKDRDWAKAVKSAADEAKKAGDYNPKKAGAYNLTTQIIEQPQPDLAPIREYIVTLDGPK
jgi:hypothetical protein